MHISSKCSEACTTSRMLLQCKYIVSRVNPLTLQPWPNIPQCTAMCMESQLGLRRPQQRVFWRCSELQVEQTSETLQVQGANSCMLLLMLLSWPLQLWVLVFWSGCRRTTEDLMTYGHTCGWVLDRVVRPSYVEYFIWMYEVFFTIVCIFTALALAFHVQYVWLHVIRSQFACADKTCPNDVDVGW